MYSDNYLRRSPYNSNIFWVPRDSTYSDSTEPFLVLSVIMLNFTVSNPFQNGDKPSDNHKANEIETAETNKKMPSDSDKPKAETESDNNEKEPKSIDATTEVTTLAEQKYKFGWSFRKV